MTFTLFTVFSGGFTTGSDSTLPIVSMTLAASQHKVEGSLGFLTYHQDESRFFPIISACLPGFNAPAIPYCVPGPKRQLTGWSLADASRLLGVGVGPMVAVSPARRVSWAAGVGVGPAVIVMSSVSGPVGVGASVV